VVGNILSVVLEPSCLSALVTEPVSNALPLQMVGVGLGNEGKRLTRAELLRLVRHLASFGLHTCTQYVVYICKT
jgi:hypothetical protein